MFIKKKNIQTTDHEPECPFPKDILWPCLRVKHIHVQEALQGQTCGHLS